MPLRASDVKTEKNTVFVCLKLFITNYKYFTLLIAIFEGILSVFDF